MGADYQGQMKGLQDQAIADIQSLPEETRKCLSHHLRNCLMAISGGLDLQNPELIDDRLQHIKKDLRMFNL